MMKATILTTAILAFSVLCAAQSAEAHSKQERTQPANGAVLETSPAEIVMQFDMPMRVTLISLTDQDGVAHDLVRTDDMQPVSAFTAAPPTLPAGQYKVEWRGLAADGHPMQGTFGFEVSN